MKKTLPLVSVIITTYNRYNFVFEAVNSVLNQTYKPIELIIIDNGSTDGTTDHLITTDNYQVIKQNHTGMPGQVKNKGVDISSGEFIAFLDSDDLWLPRKLEKQLNQLIHGNFQVNHTREQWLRNGKIVSQKSQRHKKEGDIFLDSLKKCIIGPSTVVIARKIFLNLGGFREDLEIVEDYELWLRLTAKHPVSYLEEELVIKQAGHEDQLSKRYNHIEVFRLRSLKQLIDQNIFNQSQAHQACQELIRKSKIYAAGCRKRGKQEEAKYFEKLLINYQEI